jgi:1-aminocyclopropane-1-carboxylate deaminase
MLNKFDRYRLTFGPTPIERLKRLSAHLGDKVDLYTNARTAIRASHSAATSMPDAIASNADTLVTIGVVQSNHTRQVAAVEARAQMLRRKRKRKQSERTQPLSSAKRAPECD